MGEKPESNVVSVPEEVYAWLEERAGAEGFGSANEYAVYILQEAFKKEGQGKKGALSKEDEEEVGKRLGALGYLD